ncbi:hypothetical protein LIER_07736 [Lithospermum erythrorhizon]|uniref:Uncharacterized protein n=1 Tax=Lithospermum erythrorhizon TaxID=34254 RepID=A0AAV3P9I0_LITER
MLLETWVCLTFLIPYFLVAQSATELSAQGLNAILQEYAYRGFMKNPKTGVLYDANLPKNLTGINVAAMRLRSGSMRRRGVRNYKEFLIPVGVVEKPYVERLVLVYQNLGNWSELFYPLHGYTYIAPILGLLAYNGSDLSSTNLQELNILATKESIRIHFPLLEIIVKGHFPKCVFFDLQGLFEFNNVIDGNVCLATKQGHYSIVAPAPSPPPANDIGDYNDRDEHGNKVLVVLGSVIGGVGLLVSLRLVVLCLERCRKRKKREKMEEASDRSVPLVMTQVGNTKAPMASQTRTRPMLEDENLV